MRSKRGFFLVLVLLVAAIGGLRIGYAQEAEGLDLQAQRAKPRHRGYSDGGPEADQLRKKLAAKWKEDVRRARLRGQRVDTRPQHSPLHQANPRLPVSGSGDYVYFPSADETDSRFLTLVGTVGTSTLATQISVKIAAPSTTSALELGIFDGDIGGLWDQNSGSDTKYTLYADPTGDGSGTQVINSWLGSTMPDNGWFTASIPTASTPGAQAPSGNYFYYLKAELTTPASTVLNAFKIRVNGSVRLEPQNSFNIISSLGTQADLRVVYPSYPSLSPTTYDGTWDLYVYVPSSQSNFTMWDGDWDYGNSTRTTADTDDPDTPNTSLPTWAQGTPATFEGVAVGWQGSTGDPSDDFSEPLFVRSPSVYYDVTDPNGIRFTNANPSGNQEWEQFRLDTAVYDPSVMDYHTDQVPPGVYQVHVTGLDITNLCALEFPRDLLGVDRYGRPVLPLLPYSLGDTVYTDTNGNGIQDSGETGISGVQVDLLDDQGFLLQTTTTDSNGKYAFNVDSGTYIVLVEAVNFLPGKPLNGLGSTTGGETLTRALTNASDLTYDFGYQGPSATTIGGVVWDDCDSNGTFSAGEVGLGAVQVQLWDSTQTTLLQSMTTNTEGYYRFSGLTNGTTYKVVVNSSLTPLSTLGMTATSPTSPATVTLNGSINNNVSFGFKGGSSLGGHVVNDVNANGAYDAGTDLGLGGIRMLLTADFNGDGIPDITEIATTAADGSYLFTCLPAATYSIKVDTNSIPFGVTTVFDPNGISTPNQTTFVLAANTSNNSQDFGYQGSGSIGDTVWQDTNGNGVQDTGENGISGVTVTLSGDFNNDGVADYTTSTTTDSSGKYLFSNLPAGKYTVTVSTGTLPVSGNPWLQTYDLDGVNTANQASVILPPRASNLNLDFGYQGTTTGPATLKGTLWCDSNVDGTIQSTETKITGATVKLYQGAALVGTTTTDTNGAYQFTNLTATPATTYTVKVDNTTLGTCTAPTYDYDGIGPGSVDQANATLNAGNTLVIVNFGYTQGAALGDYVWNDQNANGVQDNTETGISGVTVNLYTGNGTLRATTTTDGSGKYSFTNLAPGSYVVKVTAPATYTFSPQFQGADTTLDSNVDSTGTSSTVALKAGDNNTTIDAGLYVPVTNPASVGDYVWNDANANGIQDAGEVGLPSVTVKLFDNSNNNLIATTTTAGNGSYKFTNLDSTKTYYVTFTPPSGQGYVFSPQTQGTDTSIDSNASSLGKTAAFTLTANQYRTDIDAGIYVPRSSAGSIGDFVWVDTNNNGVQDSGETGVPGATAQLYNSTSSALVSTTTSDGNGKYLFANLDTTLTYYVKFTTPEGQGYSFTTQGGGTTTTDSDADPTTGKTGTISLATTANRTDIDCGLYKPPPASVGDFVWSDTNANGVQDSGEPGVASVTAKLYNSAGTLQATTTTNSSGAYSFTNLIPGTYYITFTAPSGYSFTQTTQGTDRTKDSNADQTTGTTGVFTLTSGQAKTDVDCGLYQAPTGTASLGDFVWNDVNGNGIQDSGETGIANVVVQLYNSSNVIVKTTTTNSSGIYSFTGLAAGSYTVHVVAPSGYAFSPLSASGSTTSNDSNTDSAGNTASITLTAGQSNLTIDSGLHLPLVSGTVWQDPSSYGTIDSGETKLSGVTVNLVQNGTTVATTTTNASGFYQFLGVTPGSYSVAIVTSTLPSTARAATYDVDGISTPGTAAITVAVGTDTTNINFGWTQGGSIGDFVWSDTNRNGIQDSGEPGISGVTVQLYNTTNNLIATTTTNGSGIYGFTNLLPGSYYVRFVAPSGYIFSPTGAGTTATDSNPDATGKTATITVTAGSSDTTIDAGLFLPPTTGSIGDYVWADLNQNGLQDAGEPGISGVAVTLYTSGGTQASATGLTNPTTTDSTGHYNFKNIPAGTYYVVFGVPSGYTFTTKNVGSDTTIDSNAAKTASTGVVVGQTPNITVSAGSVDNTIDAGLYLSTYDSPNGTITGCVYQDQNRNGIAENTEAGFSGVTVQLYDANNSLKATTTTSATGGYTFTGLLGGNYTVKVVRSTLPSTNTWMETAPYADSNPPVTNSSQDILAVTLPSGDALASTYTNACFGYWILPVVNNSTHYTTYTQGGWGGTPKGTNPASVLAAGYLKAYPSGIFALGSTHGSGSWTMTFTSANDVMNYLPAGGPGATLLKSYTNPLSTESGVLGGQLVAAQLNADFSLAGILPNTVNGVYKPLGLLTYTDATSTYNGKTVNAILLLAHAYIAAANSSHDDPSALTAALTNINQNFDNGTVNNGFLK